ncbi:MAG: Fic family protein [Bacteroidetes bacterium]|nr:Fic family protein [Bacteroidota bacterium]
MTLDTTEITIIELLKRGKELSSKEIHNSILQSVSYATVKRILKKLATENLIATIGKGKGTKYIISSVYELLCPINLETYYQKEIDERAIKKHFNFEIITNILPKISLFTAIEQEQLQSLQLQYERNIKQLSATEYQKELERLAIDLSWKSSQIEGNTYSLLETERLLKEKETASGKTKEEAVMLLNHKEAIDFIVANPDYLTPLSVNKIEGIHSILIKELLVEKNVRTRSVGISGTNYRPLDNEFQIKEAMRDMCALINKKENIFEKALLVLILISYIQPFMDGNKRTARIVSNALLIHYKCCPISFRTVNSIDYKKAMLLFYEQNNLAAFKQIFTEQFSFAVNTYF